MDPISAVGIVANVGQLIAAAVTLIHGINDIKNAPKDRARLALECANLVAFLTQFRYAIEDIGLDDHRLCGIRLLAGHDGPLEQLKKAVEGLYDKLKPGGRRTGRMLKAITWPFEKQDIDSILLRIERFKSLLSLHQEGDHFRISLQIHDDVVELKGDIEKSQKDQERQDILDWISGVDFSRKQADNLARCQRGTGGWFLKSDMFNTWLTKPPKILWCYGQPGAGKTILSSLIINHLEQRFDSRPPVAYIYFNYKEHEIQTADILTASLLKQLVQANGNISPDIISAYKRHSHKSSRPTSDEWSSLLHSEVCRLPGVFIVVDALDECSENDGVRDRFLDEIRRLQSGSRILITSRFIPSIEKELSGDLQMEIRAADDDVKQYLDKRIQNESRLVRLLTGDAELQATVVDRIVDNAKGMFLLAQLQMDAVAKKNNKRDIRRSLASLPQQLNDTYHEAMRRIWSQSEEDVDLAERLLSWIVCAKRPLKLIEVQHALAVEEGDVDLIEDGMPDEDLMISACAGLVTTDTKSKIIRLVHYTAQEYFEQIVPIRFPKAQAVITSTCLTYLCFSGLDVPALNRNNFKDQLDQYPLADYAVQFWGEHARGTPETLLEDQIIAFLGNSARTASWYRISRYLGQGYDIPSSRVEGLHIASGLGLSQTLDTLISSCSIDINTPDSAGLTALHWASRAGHEAVVRTLLKSPDIIADATNARGLTPLSLAAANGHVAIVSLFLSLPSVDPNTRDPFYGETPLWKAVDGGHDDVVQLLLDHPCIDINSKTEFWGQTPLWRAADRGHTRIVSFLTQRADIDLEMVDSSYQQTPLQRAMEGGYVEIVELLKRAGLEYISTPRSCTLHARTHAERKWVANEGISSSLAAA